MDGDSLASPEVINSLSQALSNLVLGDNEIRLAAERLLTEKWLANQPEQVILALAQLIRQAQDENMRSFAAVLLRRLAFRPVPSDHTDINRSGQMTIYDHLSEDTRFRTERALLRCLHDEAVDAVRKKVADTITDLALGSLERGRPWPELQTATFEGTQSTKAGLREVAFRIIASVPHLVLDQDHSIVLRVMQGGLKDEQSVEVRHAALRASVAYLSAADQAMQAQILGLMHPMLESLVNLSHPQLALFLRTLTPLATSNPILFRAHLTALLTFLTPLILAPSPSSQGDLSDATPTVGNPNPRHNPMLGFPSTPTAANPHGGAEDEARDEMRRSALELLVSLSEARPGMVRECPGWVSNLVRCCLEGMAEVRDEGGEATLRWAETDEPGDDDDEFGYNHVFDESLDRVACAVGGRALLPVALNYIPALLASHDWMQRHAGLMAIASIAEGTRAQMEEKLDQIVSLVTPTFQDPHPRVRYAACQCVGQLCTDLEELLQSRYHADIFTALIPTLRAPEPRVHAHAAAAVINFCAGVDGETLRPYLDPIVESLTLMLNTDSKRYVQEQAITTLAMVADAAANNFRKYYTLIMPNLVAVLRNASDPEMRTLRCKVMECAGIIAVAVGREVFQPQSEEFAELLLQIQRDLSGASDEITPQYLMSTWAKVCQALGPAFEPYLPSVMPLVLHSAAVRADVSVVDSDSDSAHSSEKEGFEVIEMQGQRIEIRTASLEEKCTAFDVLLVICPIMGQQFKPFLLPVLQLALPALKFFFHDGVRETAALLIPALVANAKHAELVTPEFSDAIFAPLVEGIHNEQDAGFLASLYKCFADSLLALSGGENAKAVLSEQNYELFIQATQQQLHTLATRRQARTERIHGTDWAEEQEDMILLEEMEGYALDEMQKALEVLDPGHSLLIAVGSVKEIHIPGGYTSDE
ncbi:ARM repeat-containing protein [Clavulina sp. PMI_390]|nr:ARM repeat-containing protein [Clavulina sp. PMI_390]